MAEPKSRPERPLHPLMTELYNLRTELGFKQYAVADDLGVSPSMISSYENGSTSPQLWFVADWAEYFGRRLVLEKVQGAPAQVKRPERTKVGPEPTVTVELTRLQVALAMGMIMAARHDDGMSPQLGEDLQRIADTLARSL